MIERRGGTQFLLLTQRLYLAEHVAIILAKRGLDLIQQQESVPFERRDLIRLLDLGLTLLGDSIVAGAPTPQLQVGRALTPYCGWPGAAEHHC